MRRLAYFPESDVFVIALSNYDSIGHLVVVDYLDELVSRTMGE
jgi:hypothetical protein